MTTLNFINRFDGVYPLPKWVNSQNFTHRFAIIQNTYSAGEEDMCFDISLCEKILDFMTSHAKKNGAEIIIEPENRDWLRADFAKASSSRTLDFAEAHLVVCRAQRTMRECRSLCERRPECNRGFRVEKAGTKKEMPLDVFLREWKNTSDDDKEPPLYIFIKRDKQILACLITEFWFLVGGPYPYADSYTYSILTHIDISGELLNFIKENNIPKKWEIGSFIENCNLKKREGLAGRVLRFIFGC